MLRKKTNTENEGDVAWQAFPPQIKEALRVGQACTLKGDPDRTPNVEEDIG